MSYPFITPFQKILSLAQYEVYGNKEVGESWIIFSTLFMVAIWSLPFKDMDGMALPFYLQSIS